MFAALNILICFIVPGLFALVAAALSISAVRRHPTIRQLVFTAFVWAANISSMTVLYQSMIAGEAVSPWPLLLIGFTVVFALTQFMIAAVLGAVGRLRRKMATV